MIRKRVLASAIAAALCGGLFTGIGNGASAQQTRPNAFTIAVPGFSEAAMLSAKNASSDRGCGGQNVSPAVQWSHPPAGTRSFAVTIVDPDGQKGLGSIHWVAYGIPAAIMSLPEGIGSSPSKDIVTGNNSQGKATFRGPCPPVGENPHHYIVAVYALDLDPGELDPGLGHDAFLIAIKGHNLAETSIVLRYQR